MTAEHKKERDAAIAAAEAAGWTVVRVTKRGYSVMRCSCGAHQETMHKSPSNPFHYRRKAARMVTLCNSEVR